MRTSMRLLLLAAISGAWIGGYGGGCTTASDHAKDVGNEPDAQKLTLGSVQRSISKGMSQDKVVEALGSPNIVTTDEHGLEVWVYDRCASQVTSSSSQGGFWLIFWMGAGQSSATNSTQRALTVVIKYDEARHVRDVAYHSSSF